MSSCRWRKRWPDAPLGGAIEKRRRHVRRHAQDPPGVAVDHGPGGFGPNQRLAAAIDESEMAVEPRAARSLADLCRSLDAVALADVAAVVDLVPGHDPGIGVDMRRIGIAHPVRGGEILHP